MLPLTAAAAPSTPVGSDGNLGVLALLSLPERPIDTVTVRQVFKHHGLPIEDIPKDRAPVDVFRSACRSVETRRSDSTSTTEVKVDPVNQAGTVYQITRMVRNMADEIIDHPKAMTVKFNPDTRSIEIVPRDPESYEALRSIEDTIRDEYAASLSRTPAKKVRSIVRKYIAFYDGMPMRGKTGGVFFIPRQGAAAMRKLQAGLQELYGEPRLDLIPMVDAAETRETVMRHQTAEVVEETQALVAKIADRMKGEGRNKVRSDMVSNVVAERKALAKRIAAYRELLDADLGTAKDALGMLDDQIEVLLEAAG